MYKNKTTKNMFCERNNFYIFSLKQASAQHQGIPAESKLKWYAFVLNIPPLSGNRFD